MPSSWGPMPGCQSIGVMRSSKLDEGLNFHLRMTVQPIATAPTQDAMTIRTVRPALDDSEVAAPDTVCAEPVSVGRADVTVWVMKLFECVGSPSLLSALSVLPSDPLAGCCWVSGVSVGWVAALVVDAEVLDAEVEDDSADEDAAELLADDDAADEDEAALEDAALDALALAALLEAEAADVLWLAAEDVAAVLDAAEAAGVEVGSSKVGGSPAAPFVPGIRSPSPGARFLIMRFRLTWSRAARGWAAESACATVAIAKTRAR